MTDQDKITALRDALTKIAALNPLNFDHNAGAVSMAHEALAMTAEASEQSGEPVVWIESEPSTRGLNVRDFIHGMCHTVIYHHKEPQTSNPVWPLYTHPATKQASAATNSEAALQALADQSQELEFTPTRRAFDQSALEQYAAERAK